MGTFRNPLSLLTRCSLCLALILAYTPSMPSQVAPAPDSAAGLSAGDWLAIQRVIQAAEPKAPTAPLLFDPWVQRAHFSPADANPSLAFGYSLAIEGDTLVVGAYWDHHLETGGGSAYVFTRPAAGWSAVTQAAKLYPSDPAFHDEFGWAVAISGDTIVVGCPYDDTPYIASSHGSAYVFVRPETGWAGTLTETAKLLASDKDYSDELGRNVAIDGDVIVVGVPYDDVDANADQGSAYVFVKPVTGWVDGTESAKLTASNGVAGNMFGASVAISGSTIVAGAYARNNGLGVGEGMVYIFTTTGDWISGTEDARLTASDAFHHEYFGWSVAVEGDLVVVGAPGDYTLDTGSEQAAYVFLKPLTGWSGDLTEDAMLIASDGLYDDDFGVTVAVDGDLVVVGAPKDDLGSQVKQGSAYVFKKPAGGWVTMSETDKLVAADGVNSDEFGTSVGVYGGVIVVGVPKDNVVAIGDHIGSTYIFTPPDYIFVPFLAK